MSTLELTPKIEMLPQEEYAMVETYVNRISELVVNSIRKRPGHRLKKT